MSTHSWKPPSDWQVFTSVEAHTAGEPLRVIAAGLPEIPGNTILEKRRFAREHLDHLRTGLMWEPRGHADMYGAIITPPVTADGDLGVLFLHNEGFSTMCGHGIIGLTKVVLDCGWVKKPEEEPVLRIDTPAGRVTATARRSGGDVRSVSFVNVPSFLYKKDLSVTVPDIGEVAYDLAFGGAFYAFCEAGPLGLGLEAADYDRIIDTGKRIKQAVAENNAIEHPQETDLGFLYGTIFIGAPHSPSHHSRNVCVFAEGEVDRSPTGTGVSARAAIHHARGELPLGTTITIESILGTCFDVRVVETTRFGPFEAVLPEVTGSAHITGENRFYFDPADPLSTGFIFR